MKRKDWKIKKLIKDIYGRKRKLKIDWEKHIFLRRLFLRKNSVLFKKNLISNYVFYNNFLKNFKLKKNKHLSNHFIFKKIINNVYNPNFFYKKKLFNYDKDFLRILKNNSLNYVFLNKNLKNNFSLKSNNIIFLKNSDYIKNKLLIENNDNKEKKDFDFITLKFFEQPKNYNGEENLNFFFNFNVNILIDLEIYKILVLLMFNQLK